MAVVIEIGSQQSFGATGCMFGAENSLQLGAAANQTLPRGQWMVALSANDIVQYTPDAGTTFRTLIPALSGGLVASDGFNVRIHNTGVADTGSEKTFYSAYQGVPGSLS